MTYRDRVAAKLPAVEPAGVDLPGAKLRQAEQVEEEAHVGGAALDHDRGLGERAPQAREGLVAVPPPGDQLGDHRVELGRDRIALGDAGVDPDPRPAREAEQRDPPRGRDEAERGILGVDARLDRVTEGSRRRALEPAPSGHLELKLEQIHSSRRLGDRMLDLQPGVDLHEGQQVLVGLVEELDRRRAPVARLEGEPDRRLTQLPLALGGERRAPRLLDHLLVAALQAAVSDAEGPGVALPVRDHLHLDVPRRLDQLLEQHRVVPEGVESLAAGARQRGLELIRPIHAADAPSAASCGRLDQQRIADPFRVLACFGDGLHGAAAPGSHGQPGLLRQPLGGDLVAKQPHRARLRADEDDPQPLTELRELRVLGHESPADPGRVGLRRDERSLEGGEIEVAGRVPGSVTLRAVVEAVRLVRLADEHRLALDLGVERDQRDRVLRSLIELAYSADRAHRRLAAIDDREPVKRAVQPGPPSSSPSGSARALQRPERREARWCDSPGASP